METITIDVGSLKYYDETSVQWKLEKGVYWVYVGNASDSISEKIRITVD